MLSKATFLPLIVYFCPMKFTLKEIAKQLQGEIVGDPDLTVSNLAKIESAQPGDITFLSNKKYTKYLEKTAATAVIVDKKIALTPKKGTSFIKVDEPYVGFVMALSLFQKSAQKKVGIHPSAVIHETAKIGQEVFIGPFVTIDAQVRIGNHVQLKGHVTVEQNVHLGDHTVVHSGVRLLEDTKVGAHCILHSGSVFGADGFGFAMQGKSYVKIPQIGNVEIKDHVEVGANCTIDRATLGSTLIQEGVKLDNMIHLAHNVEIGAHTVIAAQTGIAGSTKVGEYCVIGGQVGIVGHLTIGDRVRIQAQSGVIKNIPEGKDVQGTPAMGYKEFYKSYVHFKSFPTIENRIHELEMKK